MKLIQQGKRTKVYENAHGDYVVEVLRTHDYDGIIERTWDVEIFEDDSRRCGGGYCTHNSPIAYISGDKRENALRFAKLYENISH